MSSTITLDDADLCHLPRVAIQLARQIGIGPTMTLLSEYGGIPVWVPARMPADHPLALLLGHEAALGLAAMYGGEYLTVPRAAAAMRCTRDRQIVAAYDSGTTVSDLARQYRMTTRNIWTILGRPLPDAPVQPSLFDDQFDINA